MDIGLRLGHKFAKNRLLIGFIAKDAEIAKEQKEFDLIKIFEFPTSSDRSGRHKAHAKLKSLFLKLQRSDRCEAHCVALKEQAVGESKKLLSSEGETEVVFS